MGVSDLQFDTNAGPVVDLSARGMQKLDPGFICSEDTHTLILDRNQIMKLDYLERSPGLQQLSVASNRLVRMMGVSWLKELKVLNLPNNSIGYIEGLRDLPNLTWLNLSGNNIKVIEQLSNCVSLQHLDLSDNNISSIGDLTKLVALKTLLLHGNSITTLRTVPAHLPAHVSILSLAENEIRDLNEVSYLSPLHELEQLSIMSNPCVMATSLLPGFDYRPYIMSWCLSLKVLDGYVVSQKEGLKAEWLYSQGKGRSYRPGQHVQLVEYLATVCPLTSSPALETAEDAKLEKILSKQRFHQRQLMEESQGGCPSPPRPTQLDVEKLSPLHAEPQGGARELMKVPAASPAGVEREPVVQYNTWISGDSAQPPLSVVRSPRREEEHIYLEDMQANEDDADGSLLSSESTFLPLTSYQEPQANRSDSEDETETFEPDSLAPRRPAQHKKPSPTRQHHNPRLDKQDKSGVISSVVATEGESLIRANTPAAEMKLAHKQDGALSLVTKSGSEEPDRAAVRIQSWWRGQHARCCHPVAKEVRSEIRLRRMQDHILFLSDKLNRVQQQYEEEKLQRLVQEEAVRCLWKQLQSMQQWKQSVEQQLSDISQAVAPPQVAAPCDVAPPVASSTTNAAAAAAATDVSFPDSGFQTTGERQAGPEDSFLSSGTADSLKTVRALSPAHGSGGGGGGDSADCSLLEQYLSSVQQREEEAEEEAMSDRTETPQPPSPGKAAASPPPPPPPPPKTPGEQSAEQMLTEAARGHV